MNHRYEIGNASVGLYETVRTAAEAERSMRRLLRGCQDGPATLHDRLAHHGSIETSVYVVHRDTSHDGRVAYQYTCISTTRKALRVVEKR